jgi:hypothetical protein
LIELIGQHGDMTMPELAGALVDATGLQAHPDAIGRFLRKLGYTFKKVLVATEQPRAWARKLRDEWFRHRLPAVMGQPECVVFIDKISVKPKLTRQQGWSQRGERLVMKAPFGA